MFPFEVVEIRANPSIKRASSGSQTPHTVVAAAISGAVLLKQVQIARPVLL